jgi:hypothetical protein
LSFDRRFVVLSKIFKNTSPSEVGPYPSDVDEIGCNKNGKTCLVVTAMVPRPENA